MFFLLVYLLEKGDTLGSRIDISAENCKGCGMCMEACPTNQLSFSGKLNSHGYVYAVAANENCTGCGLCYYACPEPYAIRVIKTVKQKATV